MKSKIKALRIIAFTAVIMFLMISCDDQNAGAVAPSRFYVDPPTGIVATLLSDERTVHLTWNAVPNAGSYEISFRTNLDSSDTRRNLSSWITVTRFEHNYSWWWINMTDVTTIFYYIRSHPRQAGYISRGWSAPVPVSIR